MVSPARIDVHCHIIPDFYKDALTAAGITRPSGYPPYSPELGIELMNANGIRLAINSVSPPGVQFLDPAPAKGLARRLNEHASELARLYPGRYGAFATLPMKDMADAVAEIDHSLDTLGHQGVCLFASYGDKFLGDSEFDPVMEALDRRGAVCFVHPAQHPSARTIKLGLPAFVMEYPFDTTRGAANLIYSGALDRFPHIKFVLAHAGGALPFLAWRFGATPRIDPSLPQWPRAKFDALLRHFWYDNALACGAATMGALRTIADPGRIVFGSDWPFVQAALVAEEVQTHEEPGLHSVAERAAIDSGNALRLLGLPDER